MKKLIRKLLQKKTRRVRVKLFDASALSDMTRNVNAFIDADSQIRFISFATIHVNHVNGAWFFVGTLTYTTQESTD